MRRGVILILTVGTVLLGFAVCWVPWVRVTSYESMLGKSPPWDRGDPPFVEPLGMHWLWAPPAAPETRSSLIITRVEIAYQQHWLTVSAVVLTTLLAIVVLVRFGRRRQRDSRD